MIGVAAIVAGAIVAAALAPLARRVAVYVGALDEPGGRRRHAAAVPRGGGLAIGAAFLAVVGAAFLLLGKDAFVADNPDAVMLVRGVLLGGALALVIGWIDDVRDLSPRAQLVGQAILGLAAMSHSLWLQQFTNPLTGRLMDLRADLGPTVGLVAVGGVTLLWYAGFINTVNWLDGMDGLAATVGAVAATLFGVHMMIAFDQQALAILPLALAGACLGFLPWNFPRARLFMGSSGSAFLGFTLAALALVAPAKLATALLVMSVPIVDVAWQILYRVRHGRSPWTGDRGHLHHRLFDRGWSPLAVVLLYAGLAAGLGAIAVVVPAEVAGRGQLKLAALAVVALATVAGLWLLARDDNR